MEVVQFAHLEDIQQAEQLLVHHALQELLLQIVEKQEVVFHVQVDIIQLVVLLLVHFVKVLE
jgi:hypothetical protein